MRDQDPTLTLAQRLAGSLRDRVIAGAFKPGQKLSEHALSASLDVSRNSLREAFRLLTAEGLLLHEPNRGVFVATPSINSIIDIYRVRRVIECRSLEQSYPKHPAVARMAMAVDTAKEARLRRDWRAVGSANMSFHAAIVDLADSPRLSRYYAQIAAELRLSFCLLEDFELLHDPYIDMNAAILETLKEGRARAAAVALEAYLAQSERVVLAAFSRLTQEGARRESRTGDTHRPVRRGDAEGSLGATLCLDED